MNYLAQLITEIEYKILCLCTRSVQSLCDGPDTEGRVNVGRLFPATVWQRFAGKRVLDLGCGLGHDAVEIARRGASFVVGIDIQEGLLESARTMAHRSGVADRCLFSSSTDDKFDVIISINAFEHIADTGAALRLIRDSMAPGGVGLIAFGPTWFHPHGGHFFNLFPWAHIIFREEAILKWRSGFVQDGARRFEDITGGLNRMTISRFHNLVKSSGLTFRSFECVPIETTRLFHNRFTREFLTSFVRCELELDDTLRQSKD
jgi:2-polyprenyl-3-methyl-5-hydroxy-6-metoxy-1,4-benzoquinol methylase